MIETIYKSAEAVGVEATVLDAQETLDTALKRVTREGNQPTMLISWDYKTRLAFDRNGFLKNPLTEYTILLVEKPESKDKADAIESAEKMAALFVAFVEDLNQELLPNLKPESETDMPIKEASFQNVPRYGISYHSGVLAKLLVDNIYELPCN